MKRIALLAFLLIGTSAVAQQSIQNLPAVTTPAPTDIFPTAQTNPQSPSGYSTRGETSNQLKSAICGPFGCGSGAGSGGNFLSVASAGMVPGGTDNAPFIPAMMNLVAAATGGGVGGQTIVFPGVSGHSFTAYYFSQALSISRTGEYKCSGVTGSNQGGTELVFAAGVDGVIQEDGSVSADGGWGEGTVEGCTIVSLGFGTAVANANSGSITSVNMSHDPGGLIPASTWGIGDGIFVTPRNSGGLASGAIITVDPGAYVSGVSGSTLTLAGSYTTSGSLGSANPLAIYRLPAALKYTVQTTIGSNSVLVTAGPRKLIPGDVVWSDAFPFGTTVFSVSGALGNQTAIMNIPFVNTTAQNATVTHTGGAPGQMWVLPAGLKRDTSAKSNQNFISQWPIGLEMACSSGSGFNCTTSHDSYNLYELNAVGRWTAGNNTGASDSVGEEGANNYITDVMEGGTLGTTYVNYNSNSGESGSALYSIMGNCINQNFSTFVGGYIGFTTDSCAAPVGIVPATVGTWPLFIGSTNGGTTGSPQVNFSSFNGPWVFYTASPSTSAICINYATWYVFGFSSASCSTGSTWGLGWNTTYNSWDLSYANDGYASVRFGTVSNGYIGYSPFGLQTVIMPNGVQLGSFNDDAIGQERLLDGSAILPTEAWHLQGDVHLNAAPVPGGAMAWTDTPSFTTTLSGAVTGGVTTSVSVAACPSPSLPAGTPVIDKTGLVTDGVGVLSRELGTLSTCSGTTLTLQAVAVNDGVSSDTIQFLQWRPAAPVAADTGGIVWPLGTPTAIASLPTCSATTVGYAVVNNGVASPTYNGAVSTTGSSTRPVFCDGSGWTYH